MKEHESIFREFLDKKGLKFTQPRKLILSAVFSLHKHFDAEQLYDLIRKISDDVSRATVYRTIPLLMQAGLIQRSVRSELRDNYEHIYGHPKHTHWVCEHCGCVFETVMYDIRGFMYGRYGIPNFKVKDINITVKGICPDCRKKLRSKKV